MIRWLRLRWLGIYFNFGKSVKINITLMSGILGDDGMELTLVDASGVYLRKWRSRFAGGILLLTHDHHYHHHKQAFPSSIMRWCMRYATFSCVNSHKAQGDNFQKLFDRILVPAIIQSTTICDIKLQMMKQAEIPSRIVESGLGMFLHQLAENKRCFV